MYEYLDNGQVLLVEYIGNCIQKTAFCNYGEQDELLALDIITAESKALIDGCREQ